MGHELIKTLIQLSGLPEEYAYNRICSLIEKTGKNIETLQLDDVRLILSDLLTEIVLDNKFIAKSS